MQLRAYVSSVIVPQTHNPAELVVGRKVLDCARTWCASARIATA
jgi:hypothetical protein